MDVSASNAESYRFVAVEHFDKQVALSSDSFQVGDGGNLVLDESGIVGKKEFSL